MAPLTCPECNVRHPGQTDKLLFGRLYFPEPRLDALYVHRLSARLQALVSLISVPSPSVSPPLTWASNAEPPAPDPAERLSELEVKLQTDAGRWSSEYSYAVGDAMLGAKVFYNFAKSPLPSLASSAAGMFADAASHAEDERDSRDTGLASSSSTSGGGDEEAVSTGLKGRWSAGGEVYFSAQERAAGLSTGVRFATLPGTDDYQSPTVITATLNPIMGHLSTAYAVRVDSDTALASRFDFNMYSYDAELSVGAEWFFTRNKRHDAALGTTEQRPAEQFDAFGRGVDAEPTRLRTERVVTERKGPDSVLKFRASTNDASASFSNDGSRTSQLTAMLQNMALLWEGRVGQCLVSAGMVADLRLATKQGGRRSPIRSVGLSVMYWA